MSFDRATLFPEGELPAHKMLLDEGSALARNWQVQPGAFLRATGFACEADYKRAKASEAKVMSHAHMGFRDTRKSLDALGHIYTECEKRGARIDRFGITLDWSMGMRRDERAGQMQGTGLVLKSPEAFAALGEAAPAAPHFGDFVLGFPASVENVQGALSAGSTAIGNLGQYFTFRLPGHTDDIEATAETVKALGLIAAQKCQVLVHSNLDDGFAAVFRDLGSVLGAALVEKYIVEDLIGASLVHCYGHHFTEPVRRLAFHLALKNVSTNPGTMVYGNTVSYRGTHAENYAALANYLSVDIAAQLLAPSGHAINPVPVSENERIPDAGEIIDAQCFAARMMEQAVQSTPLIDTQPAQQIANRIVQGAMRFKENLLKGFKNAGIDITSSFEMLLAIRRIGGRTLETLYGTNPPTVTSPLVEELEEHRVHHLGEVTVQNQTALKAQGLSVLSATTDVHEHGKMVLDNVLTDLGVRVFDGGVSCDVDVLADQAKTLQPDAIALSTYNGVALTYARSLKRVLERAKLNVPILIGGRLNQIPEGSNTSLPVDVSEKLRQEGFVVCEQIEDAVPALLKIKEKT
ncbi:MAG: cobalamin-dependent protein [Hyphomicrobiales bacterium]